MTTRTTLNKRMRLIEAAGLVAPTTKTNSPYNGALSSSQLATLAPKQVPTTTTTPSLTALPLLTSNSVPVDDFMDTSCFEPCHPNTIVHIDIDCFYAQVEEIRQPHLRLVPLGIQQKNCLVTCNYLARAKGIRKLMSVQEAQQLCPELVLVKGEDLTPYRQMSSRVFEHITRQYPQLSVERLGMDENFVDVTRLVEEREKSEKKQMLEEKATVIGCTFPPPSMEESNSLFTTNCLCGCQRRLIIGTHIAAELRASLQKDLGITTCAGIAHNKMLAKLAGALNKPNNQTVVVPTKCRDLMVHLKELRSVPGIGAKTESLLNEIQVTDIESLQRVDQTALVLKFGPEMAKKLKDWSYGVDQSQVRSSSIRPKTIGLEDSCPKQPISVRQEIEDKFRGLLQRLLGQVAEDGRIPVAIKMTLRKYDAVRKTSHRETKQANILPTLFQWNSNNSVHPSTVDGNPNRLSIVSGGEEKVLQIVMRLFERVIDLRLPFNVTLLGLAFSKFQERSRMGGTGSIANYLLKGGKKDLEVQSVTSLTSEGTSAEELPSPVAQFTTIGRFYREQQRDLETMSDTMSVASDVSEQSEVAMGGHESSSGVEPSPKKSRLALNFMAKRRCFGVQQGASGAQEPMDCASPSKLRVSELRLNSVDRDSGNNNNNNNNNNTVVGLDGVNRDSVGATGVKGDIGTLGVVPRSEVDPEVFRELPADVQNELIRSWAAVAVVGGTEGAVGVGMGTRQKMMMLGAHQEVKGILVAKNGSKQTAAQGTGAATLHRYFIANK